MSITKIISTILLMLASLAIFLFGLKLMSEHLEKQAGSRLRHMFNKATKNNLMGVGVGAGVTAIIQSSSATTVMIIGFVNAGIISLTQAAAIIMGANVGTTVTALIISLPITEFVAAFGLVGVFIIMFSQKSRLIGIGYIILGFSMIFTGLAIMGNSMEIFAELQSIRNFFAAMSHPLLLILFGALTTAIIQSSSATTGILITLARSNLLGIESAIFIILGINIGTCITALLASIGANINARRAATIHLIFNVAGTLIIGIPLLFSVIRKGIVVVLTSLGSILPASGIGAQIAAFHIFFNITTTILLLPFLNLIVKTTVFLLPDKKKAKKDFTFIHLDELILKSTPSIAVAQIKKEILRMASMAKSNLEIAIDAIENINLKNIDEFMKTENYLDWLNREIPVFLTKLSSRHLRFEDEKIISSYYHVIIDLERIGDYAENILEYAKRMDNEGLRFSEEAIQDMQLMYTKLQRLYAMSISGFKYKNKSLAKEIDILEDLIDEYKKDLSEKHVKRLDDGVCKVQAGALFLSLISNLERIADHSKNIFNSISKY